MTSLTILGGGPAGLGLAFYAHRAGVPFVLLEASSDLGGMCRTFRCGEHLYDCGAHRFHDRDPEITQDVFELLGDSLRRVDAPSAVRDRGRFIDFPPTPLNAIFAYGLRGAGRIGLDLVRSLRRRRGPAASFEDLAIATFGETLARRILLNYSAKLWGLPPDQLSPDVATRRLRGMTLRSLIHEVVSPRRRVSHVDGSFLYPRRGYGEIVEALTRALPPESIRLRCEVVALQSRGGVVTQVVCSGGRTVERPDRIVSTLPLPLLVRLLGDALPDEARAAAGRLRLRQVRLIFLRLGTPSLSDYASIYVPDPAFCVSRIYEPRNRSAEMAPDGETSVVAEVPCFPGDDAERLADGDLANRVVDELAALGLLNPADVVEWRHHRIPNAYPVYSIDYAGDVRVIESALAAVPNLDTIGRAGRFVYSHLHDQLRFGKDYVRTLTDSEAPSSPRQRRPEPSADSDARRPLPLATPRLLASRLISAVRRTPSDPADEAWVRSILTPAEHELWSRQSVYDRGHAIRVARKLQRRLASTAYGDDPLWPSAALMHDIGKLRFDLSLRERVVAAVASKTVGVGTARRWAHSGVGARQRIGSYLIHGEAGAKMIRAVGGRDEIAAWAEVHQGYKGVTAPGIPPIVAEALIASDAG